ncbi:exodeoxyribonuclease VII, small subunit [Caldicellulosiruptor kronotskyensis 2002]|uniref:Exodeoxyribonuclease 7 small subunit n=1 Tax=Caldicellulosiruptor kronotskyensis (strain DSM 18902 / VKM B-2412 / 2002) TaxID=632348 RepID=E4SFK5_CALK2|nr:exodeoxyribonuclease VII small subunit [Caldicellulosiruptor kronotskyensis]ADQ46530.1 exodeoxyribonuclease VII, small subunit [Caldicellulosiruptor kronotskyensis 2002]
MCEVQKDIKFEDAMKRLEEIVKSLEDGNLSLEEAIELYEEGIRLTKICNDILRSVEKRVVLIEKLNGEYIQDDITNDIYGGLGQKE